MNNVKLETSFTLNEITCSAYMEVEFNEVIDILTKAGIEVPKDVNTQKLLIKAFTSGFRIGGSLGRANANFTNEFFPREVEESEEEDV